MRRAALSVTSAVATMGMVVAGVALGGIVANADVTGPADPVSYTEQAPPVLISTPGNEFTIDPGPASYDGGYVDFEVGAGDEAAFEQLSLATVATEGEISEADGEISIFGTTVYLGNGDEAEVIGSVDSIYNGQNGVKLRINFARPFENSSFEEPLDGDGNPPGWTLMKQWINLGVTEIAGHVSIDGTGATDDRAPSSATYTAVVQSDSVSGGSSALRLTSTMTTAAACDVVHGPAAYSEPFEAAAGDKIEFDWRAYNGSDAYHVFGYIVDQDGTQTTLLNDTRSAANTSFATSSTVVPADGTYSFVFVAGTKDQTCGRAAGASLVIDNVRVFSTSKVDATAVEALIGKVRYANDSDNPSASRTVTVTDVDGEGNQGTPGQVTIDITPVDDPPMVNPTTIRFGNTDAEEDFGDKSGQIQATDPDDDDEDITYHLDPAKGTVTTVDGDDVDGGFFPDDAVVERQDGDFGTLYLDVNTGAYLFVPDDDAINAVDPDENESDDFTVNVVSGGLTVPSTISIEVGEPIEPDAPTNVRAVPTTGNRIEVTWDAPANDGGRDITDYRIEYSTDGGTTWSTAAQVDADDPTSYVTNALTAGTTYAYRVVAINEIGDSDPSAVNGRSRAVAGTAPAFDTLRADPTDDTVELSWKVPAGVTGITGYEIQVQTGPDNWETIASPTGALTGYSVTAADLDEADITLTPGVSYNFRIAAKNAAGTGAPSNEAAAAPGTIAGIGALVAEPGDGTIELQWETPTGDGSDTLTGYTVERWDDDTDSWVTVEEIDDPDATSYRVDDLENGEASTYRIIANNAFGAGSPSNEVTSTPRKGAETPEDVTAVAGDGEVVLSWNPPSDDGGDPVTGYRIEAWDEVAEDWVTVGTVSAPDTSYTVTGLTNGEEGTYRVAALNSLGAGQRSSEVSATPRTTPDDPTITSIESGNHSLIVSFDEPAFDGGAPIEYYEYTIDGGTTWIQVPATASPLVIYGLDNDQDYDVAIRAVNEAGGGSASNSEEGTPTTLPVKVPTGSGLALKGVAPGASEATVNGVASPVTVSTDGGIWKVTGDDFTASVESYKADGTLVPDSQGRLVVLNDGSITVSGSGYLPGSTVDVWLLGGSKLLGQATVGLDGTFSADFAVPAGLALGDNTLQINGLSEDGELRTLSTGLLLVDAAGLLALSGAEVLPLAGGGLLLLLIGAVTLMVARKHRRLGAGV